MENCNCEFCMTNYDQFSQMKVSSLKNFCKTSKLKGYSTKRTKVELVQFIVVSLKKEKRAQEQQNQKNIIKRNESKERDRIYDEELSLILSEFPKTHTMSSKIQITREIFQIITNCQLYLPCLDDIINVRFIFGKKLIMLVKHHNLYIPTCITPTMFFSYISNQKLFFKPYCLKKIFYKCARGPFRKILTSNL